jgi:hypothetical protein
MKLVKAAVAAMCLSFAFVLPGVAQGSGESLSASFNLTPQTGSFYKQGQIPANWSVESQVSTADPQILPAKTIDLKFPPQSEMSFNPNPKMPVCPDSQVGPNANVSQPVPDLVALCPNSLIGNGTAKFVLGQNNQNPANVLDGQLLAFHGGLRNGRPLVKVAAYSYDTQVGIYTEAVMAADGRLTFANIPVLTADSSVSSLNLAIPSENVRLNLPLQGITVTLPKGKDPNYVRARCSTGSWAYDATFTLGTRDTNGDPTSPDSFISDSGTTSCNGLPGSPKGKLARPTVKGPKSARRGRAVNYTVRVRNTGVATATGVRVQVQGKGVKANVPVGSIAPGQARNVRVRAAFRQRGRVRATVRVVSKNAGSAQTTVNVRVR